MAAAGNTSHSHNHKDDANGAVSIYASTCNTVGVHRTRVCVCAQKYVIIEPGKVYECWELINLYTDMFEFNHYAEPVHNKAYKQRTIKIYNTPNLTFNIDNRSNHNLNSQWGQTQQRKHVTFLKLNHVRDSQCETHTHAVYTHTHTLHNRSCSLKLEANMGAFIFVSSLSRCGSITP